MRRGKEIRDQLREVVRDRDVTQAMIAKYIGVTNQTVSNMMNDYKYPYISAIFERALNFLGCDIEVIIRKRDTAVMLQNMTLQDQTKYQLKQRIKRQELERNAVRRLKYRLKQIENGKITAEEKKLKKEQDEFEDIIAAEVERKQHEEYQHDIEKAEQRKQKMNDYKFHSRYVNGKNAGRKNGQ